MATGGQEGDGSSGRRYKHNLQGLLQFSTEVTSPDPEHTVSPMDPEAHFAVTMVTVSGRKRLVGGGGGVNQTREKYGEAIKRQDKALSVLGLYRYNIIGDGNCMFRAVAQQLNIDQEKDHIKLRAIASKWMKNHADDLLAGGLIDNLDEISDTMKPGHWPGQAALVALANKLMINIAVIQGGDEGNIDIQHFAPFQAGYKADHHIVLVYLYTGHYDTAVDTPDLPNPLYNRWKKNVENDEKASEELARTLSLEESRGLSSKSSNNLPVKQPETYNSDLIDLLGDPGPKEKLVDAYSASYFNQTNKSSGGHVGPSKLHSLSVNDSKKWNDTNPMKSSLNTMSPYHKTDVKTTTSKPSISQNELREFFDKRAFRADSGIDPSLSDPLQRTYPHRYGDSYVYSDIPSSNIHASSSSRRTQNDQDLAFGMKQGKSNTKQLSGNGRLNEDWLHYDVGVHLPGKDYSRDQEIEEEEFLQSIIKTDRQPMYAAVGGAYSDLSPSIGKKSRMLDLPVMNSVNSWESLRQSGLGRRNPGKPHMRLTLRRTVGHFSGSGAPSSISQPLNHYMEYRDTTGYAAYADPFDNGYSVGYDQPNDRSAGY